VHCVSFCVALLLSAACSRGAPEGGTRSSRPAEDLLRPYAPGSWRLARHELHRSVLTVSQILIEHEKSLSPPKHPGRPDEPSPGSRQRTREQARARALEVAQKARAQPAQFSALAHAYSDDLRTAARGGSLGTLNATTISPPLLDALSAMQAGETSRVIETERGFYVLHLQPTLAEFKVAARRILIGYAGTRPIFPRTSTPIERSREQAFELAKQVASEASRDTSRFGQLVERYTDHNEALRGGDVGVWSSYEASGYQRELDAIAALPIGAVSEPLDGGEGFSVFLRTEVTERPEIAVSFLRVHDGNPGIPVAKSSELRGVRRGRSEDFERLRALYCCADLMQWPQGRGDPRIEQLVSSLPIGAVATRPVAHGKGFYHYYRRVQPQPRDPGPRIADVLPRPRSPDVDGLVRAVKGDVISEYIGSLKQSLGESLGLDLDERRRRELGSVFDELAEQMRTGTADQREPALRAARERLKALLDEREYASIQANVRSELTRRLLGSR
jgi:hypothetical protein